LAILRIDKEIGNRFTPTLKTTPHEELTMYDLIQSALTAAIDFTAIAGLTGIAAHAIWKRHTTWMSAYCPSVAPYTPDTRVEEEVAPPEPEPEVPAIDSLSEMENQRRTILANLSRESEIQSKRQVR
jgi:hypothetical protein